MSGLSVEELAEQKLQAMRAEDEKRRSMYTPMTDAALRDEYDAAYNQAVVSQRRLENSGSAE